MSLFVNAHRVSRQERKGTLFIFAVFDQVKMDTVDMPRTGRGLLEVILDRTFEVANIL